MTPPSSSGIAWVLSAAHTWDRATIHDRLARLARTRGVVLEDLELVEAALERYRVGKADLADYLIAGKARSVGAELLTFDKRARTACVCFDSNGVHEVRLVRPTR